MDKKLIFSSCVLYAPLTFRLKNMGKNMLSPKDIKHECSVCTSVCLYT